MLGVLDKLAQMEKNFIIVSPSVTHPLEVINTNIVAMLLVAARETKIFERYVNYENLHSYLELFPYLRVLHLTGRLIIHLCRDPEITGDLEDLSTSIDTQDWLTSFRNQDSVGVSPAVDKTPGPQGTKVSFRFTINDNVKQRPRMMLPTSWNVASLREIAREFVHVSSSDKCNIIIQGDDIEDDEDLACHSLSQNMIIDIVAQQ